MGWAGRSASSPRCTLRLKADGGSDEPKDFFAGGRGVFPAGRSGPRAAHRSPCVGGYSKHFDPNVGKLDRSCRHRLSCIRRLSAVAEVSIKGVNRLDECLKRRPGRTRNPRSATAVEIRDETGEHNDFDAHRACLDAAVFLKYWTSGTGMQGEIQQRRTGESNFEYA